MGLQEVVERKEACFVRMDTQEALVLGHQFAVPYCAAVGATKIAARRKKQLSALYVICDDNAPPGFVKQLMVDAPLYFSITHTSTT